MEIINFLIIIIINNNDGDFLIIYRYLSYFVKYLMQLNLLYI